MIDLNEYSPVPFWFWNGDLDKTEIKRQILEFKKNGIDIFLIHPRIGLSEKIGYLSNVYFDFVKFAVETASENSMAVYLYDEAMYPSGSCHGEVVLSNPNFASKGLKKTRFPKKNERIIAKTKENGVDCYYVTVYSNGTIRGIFVDEDDNEKNAPKSADLLNADAVECFIEKTHEKYYKNLREYFGTTIKGFFTDEPCILGRNHEKNIIAWTDNFLDDYLSEGGDTDYLYALFDKKYNSDDEIHAQKCYDKAIYNHLSKSYYSKLSDWCAHHDISLIGHPEKSTDIGYLKYFQIPCQDLVWRYVKPDREGYFSEKKKTYIFGEHSAMAKCSSDSARHRGKRRNGNEIFGCCGHIDDPQKIDEGDIKWYLNYLFVRGVNLIIPHAFYYSVNNNNFDRPPNLGVYSSLWCKMGNITNYIKRMCYILTDCINQAQAAILCSFNSLSDIAAKPFYENQVEFNYLEVELLQECKIENKQLKIKNQNYSCLVRTEKNTVETEKILNQFQAQGIKIIDARENNFFSTVLDSVEKDIIVDKNQEDLRYSHIIKDNYHIYIFTNEGEKKLKTDIEIPTAKSHAAVLLNMYTMENEKIILPRFSLSLDVNECKIIYYRQ